MYELSEILRNGLSFSGDICCPTATIVTKKPKQEMDYNTLRCLFYIAAHQNIRNEMTYTVTQKDIDDLGVTVYDVLDCLADLSYCTGIVKGIPSTVVYGVEVSVGEITVESPYFFFLFQELCNLGSPQEILQSIDWLVKGVN